MSFDASQIAEAYGGEVRYADSTIQEAGGHPLHVQGGAEIMWQQVGHLTLAFREVAALADFLRAYTCPGCGEPAAIHMADDDPSPFLKYAIGASHE